MRFANLYSFSLLPALAMALLVAYSPVSEGPAPATKPAEVEEGVQWMTMAEAMEAMKKEKKLLFIDVYTDWCGWCKVMDRETFSQAEVAEIMNEHFYNVKLNAEKDDPVTVNGNDFELVDAGGRRQIHTLAYALLDGQLSYPSYVYLTGDFERIYISKGFKKPGPFVKELERVLEATRNIP